MSNPYWKCPKCGEEKMIQGVGSFKLKPLNDGTGLSLLIPQKIWCMVCQKEYDVSLLGREKVQFT